MISHSQQHPNNIGNILGRIHIGNSTLTRHEPYKIFNTIFNPKH